MFEMMELAEEHRHLDVWRSHPNLAKKLVSDFLMEIATSINALVEKNPYVYEEIFSLGRIGNVLSNHQACVRKVSRVFDCYINLICATPHQFLENNLDCNAVFIDFHMELEIVKNDYLAKIRQHDVARKEIADHFILFSKSACKVQAALHDILSKHSIAALVYKLMNDTEDIMRDCRPLIAKNSETVDTFKNEPPLFIAWQKTYTKMSRFIASLKNVHLKSIFVDNRSTQEIVDKLDKTLKTAHDTALVALTHYIDDLFTNANEEILKIYHQVNKGKSINIENFRERLQNIIKNFNDKIKRLGADPSSGIEKYQVDASNALNRTAEKSIKAVQKIIDAHKIDARHYLNDFDAFLRKMNDNFSTIPPDCPEYEIVNALGSLSAQYTQMILNKARAIDPKGKRGDKRLFPWMREQDLTNSADWRHLDEESSRFFRKVDERIYGMLDKMEDRAISIQTPLPDTIDLLEQDLKALNNMLISIKLMTDCVVDLKRSISLATQSLDVIYALTIYNQYLEHIVQLEGKVKSIYENILKIKVYEISDNVASTMILDLEAKTMQSILDVIKENLNETDIDKVLLSYHNETSSIAKRSSPNVVVLAKGRLFTDLAILVKEWITDRNLFLEKSGVRAEGIKLYKKLSMKYHPDRLRDSSKEVVATEIFKRLVALHEENIESLQQNIGVVNNVGFLDFIDQCKKDITVIKTKHIRKVHLALLELRLSYENDSSLNPLKEKCKYWENMYCYSDNNAIVPFDHHSPDLRNIDSYNIFSDFSVHGDKIIFKARRNAEKLLSELLNSSEWVPDAEHQETIQGLAKKIVNGSIDPDKYFTSDQVELSDFSVEVSVHIKELLESFDAAKKQLTQALSTIKTTRDSKDKIIRNAKKYYEAEINRWQHAHVFCEWMTKLESALNIQYVTRQYAMPLDNSGRRTVGIEKLPGFHDDCYLRFCKVSSKIHVNHHGRFCSVQQALLKLPPARDSFFQAVSCALGYLSNQHNYTGDEVRKEFLAHVLKNGSTYHKPGDTEEETKNNVDRYLDGLSSGSVLMDESYLFGVADTYKICVAVTYLGQIENVDGKEILKTRYYGSPENQPIYLAVDEQDHYDVFIPMDTYLKKLHAQVSPSKRVSSPLLHSAVFNTPAQVVSQINSKASI